MGADKPLEVSAEGGRFAMRDAGEIPDILQVTYRYPGFVLSYEACTLNGHGMGGRTPGMRYYNARGAEDRPHGMAFYGTSGALFAERTEYEVYPERDRTARRQGNVADATREHAKAFVECVRSRRRPPADAETGHRATLVAHIGNIAYKTGRKLRWDGEKEEFIGDAEANALLARAARRPWDLIRI
jgi:predicted dehydrogenase